MLAGGGVCQNLFPLIDRGVEAAEDAGLRESAAPPLPPSVPPLNNLTATGASRRVARSSFQEELEEGAAAGGKCRSRVGIAHHDGKRI